MLTKLTNFLIITSALLIYISSGLAQSLAFGNWDKFIGQDGYIIGNGHLYAIVGLGKELSRYGKSDLIDVTTPLTRIAWIIGPQYTIGNLGYGWEIKPCVRNHPIKWETEKIIPPSAEYPHWSIECENNELFLKVTDTMIGNEPALLRRILIKRHRGLKPASISLNLPIYPDPRNSIYRMFNGAEVKAEVISTWRDFCGDNLKPRSSVSKERLQQIHTDLNVIIQVGANRALWQEISTIVPEDSIYEILFPPRALATTITSDDENIRIGTTEYGFNIEFTELKSAEEKRITVWIVTVSGKDQDLEQLALQELHYWTKLKPDSLLAACKSEYIEPIVQPIHQAENEISRIIDACSELVRVCQSSAGGILAQPYMYPMCYVRDQYGSFRLFLSLGEYDRAYKILRFYVAMQNRDGIQNAHDAPAELPDLASRDVPSNLVDGHWKRAEVPSYIILMARDYFQYTNDYQSIQPFYDRLAYNLRIQKRNRNGLLPWAHDESYTNSTKTRPEFEDEMTDSNILYIAAAKFMVQLAKKLRKDEDCREFQRFYDETFLALMKRLWLKDKKYFAYARDSSNNSQNIDTRPALDALLRWQWLEMSTTADSIMQGCLNGVLENLINPIRVVPETFDFTTGMDPGYLLYALSRTQHPAMHSAANILLNYASSNGLFCEYYRSEDQKIIPFGGILRPWESSICAQSLIQYILGLGINWPEKKILIQPHLPYQWKGWQSKRIPIFRERFIQLEMQKLSEKHIKFSLVQFSGSDSIEVDLELGGFGMDLRSLTSGLVNHPQRRDLLISKFYLEPFSSKPKQIRREFIFEIVN